MERIKKILAFTLAMVMMMAMSITAFADATVVLTINGLQEGDKVDVYKIASVTDDNKVEFADWIKNTDGTILIRTQVTEQTKELSADEVKVLADKFNGLSDAEKAAAKVASQVATGTTVTFTDAALGNDKGAYLIKASGADYSYAAMVQVTFDVDDNGIYVLAPVTVTAKGMPNEVDKIADDTFVAAGQTVNFTITSTIPTGLVSYKIFDEVTNLTAPTVTSVKLDDTALEGKAFELVEGTTNKYVMDFDDQATNYGSVITIQYTATVVGNDGYINTAYDSTVNSKEATYTGYTGDIELTKKGPGENGAVLAGAEFTLAKVKADGTYSDNLKFTKNNDGDYVLDADGEETLVTDADGKLKVTGLDEGNYKFIETKAPAGYSINADIEVVEINPVLSADSKHAQVDIATEDLSKTLTVIDSTLIRLPFTGGSGTMIFTVLGVAFMTLGAGAYFLLKRKS